MRVSLVTWTFSSLDTVCHPRQQATSKDTSESSDTRSNDDSDEEDNRPLAMLKVYWPMYF